MRLVEKISLNSWECFEEFLEILWTNLGEFVRFQDLNNCVERFSSVHLEIMLIDEGRKYFWDTSWQWELFWDKDELKLIKGGRL